MAVLVILASPVPWLSCLLARMRHRRPTVTWRIRPVGLVLASGLDIPRWIIVVLRAFGEPGRQGR
jgi:hypothetical protein